MKGGAGAARNCFVLFACECAKMLRCARLGAGTTLHAAAPPGKVVFARPHRDSGSWGAALRACSWSASRDGHVRGVASRRSRQSCSPSTAASLTSCRAAQTMSTAPSTGTEAHERRATRQRAQRALGFPPARCLTSQGTRPRAPVPPPRSAGTREEVCCLCDWKSVKAPPPPLSFG